MKDFILENEKFWFVLYTILITIVLTIFKYKGIL